MKLIIVESPAKAKTIKKFLGQDYTIKATFGHIRDLPKDELGVEIEKDFRPKYLILPRSFKLVQELKGIAQRASNIFLATDFDREGEAIAWHISEACGFAKIKNKKLKIKNDKIKRITFVEITPEAIKKAVRCPREIDLNLVEAQKSRRILDRLVGYKLSPFLWEKIKSGLSAGRVQSAALRLITEREREIEAFIPSEYWEIEAELQKKPKTKNQKQKTFIAKLIKKDNKKIKIKNEKKTKEIISDLEKAEYKVDKITKKEVLRFPYPPFTTSTLQQEASYKLGFSAKKTMFLAQQLYEGIKLDKGGQVGLITYMRTDSVNLSWLAINTTRKYIEENLGKDFLPARPKVFKTKSIATQEAHEAIRPTYIQKTPDSIKKYLTSDQDKLYKLIWQKMVACQMKDARFEETNIQIIAQSPEPRAQSYLFEAKSLKNIFPGYLKIYQDAKTEEIFLPVLGKDEKLDLVGLIPSQKFTQPPYRYTEASLIRSLEENGIGRPSTYAPILSTIQDRGYVSKEGKFLKPTEIGKITNDFLVLHFPEIVDINFTSKMEKELDEIATGEVKWVSVLNEFYKPFEKHLAEKYKKVKKIKIVPELTKEVCQKCGKPMVVREGRYGKFLACSGFPKCKNTKPIVIEIEVPCPYCGGKIIQKRVRRGKARGRVFYSCSNYPSCKFSSWDEPTEYRCSKCDFIMGQKGKILTCLRCKNKEVLKYPNG